MPRRNRTGVLSQLPPLTFVNSPVYQPAPVLTPDYAADNPITAKAVPVEDFTETMWVSPQFYSAHKTQRSSLGMLTRARHKSGGTLKNTQLRQSKFRPLQFLSGEKEVDITVSTSPSGTSKLRHVAPVKGKNAARNYSEEGKVDNGPIEEICEAVIYTPIITETSNTAVLVDNEKENICVTTRDSSDVLVERTDGDRGEPLHSPVVRNTSVGHKRSLTPRNLFGTNISSKLVIEPLRGEVHESISLSERRITRSRSLSDAAKTEQQTNSLSSPGSCFEKVFLDSPRRSEMHFDTHKSVILAADTPECDYGLSFRQRQIKYYLRNRSVTS